MMNDNNNEFYFKCQAYFAQGHQLGTKKLLGAEQSREPKPQPT